MAPHKTPFGNWCSPITADALVSDSPHLLDVVVDPVTSKIYHIERRPLESGRSVLVQTSSSLDVVGPQHDVRTTVHEHGGAAAIAFNDTAYFSNSLDGRVYRIRIQPDRTDPTEAEPITPLPPKSQPRGPTYRFANFQVHPTYHHLLVAVMEDHTLDIPATVVNTLCVIDAQNKSLTQFVKGADFYASPLFSSDGRYIAWCQWNHPDMPWQGGEIHVAEVVITNLDGGEVQLGIKNSKHIAGEKSTISAAFPVWVNDTTLTFLTDVSGYSNPWIYDVDKGVSRPILKEPTPMEFGGLLKFLNRVFHAPIGDKWGIYVATRDGQNALFLVNYFEPAQPVQLKGDGVTELVTASYLRTVERTQGIFTFMGGHVDKKLNVMVGEVDICHLESLSNTETHMALDIQFTTLYPTGHGDHIKDGEWDAYVSPPIPKTLGPVDAPVHVVLYLPKNPNFEGTSIEGEKPPCVVYAHGGPTAMMPQSLDWSRLYWTSRGWAWLDVNYGGSSGYGRAYQDRLEGNWGISDAEDCILAAQILSSSQIKNGPFVDSSRMVIRGTSAGAYTTLLILSSQKGAEIFAAGTSLYGVTNVQALINARTKFKAYYTYNFMGGPPEDIPDIYEVRSPAARAARAMFKRPLLVLHGSDDKLVPKDHADVLVSAIRNHSPQVQPEYHIYAGEGHGWRKAETVKDAIRREISFYAGILGIELAGPL